MSDKTIHQEREGPADVATARDEPAPEVMNGRDGSFSEEADATADERRAKRKRHALIVAAVALVAVAAICALLWMRGDEAPKKNEAAVAVGTEHTDEHAGEGDEIKLAPEALQAARLEIEGVTQRPAVALLKATGTVETNQERTVSLTPLVSGRIEQVRVGTGDRVRQGDVLAALASPQIAQMHGKLHEAETRLNIARRNLERVQRAENRVAVLQAKARLDEAEATLKRTRRLIELGAGAGKDLIAAETAYRTAKADYEFQSNISLNKELQEARAEVETARVDVAHIRDELRAFGAPVPEGERDDHSRDTSLVYVRAPASGIVTERLINVGAGVEAGKPLFTIANISTVWIIANVPEAQIGVVREGTPAEIRAAALGEGALAGRVSYIDPQLNEETRTGRVRILVNNPNERLKAGMFVEVSFQTSTGAGVGEELVVPSAAIQREGSRTVVFIPKETEAGAFEVREIEVGGEVEGYTRVRAGLQLGERVVTKGSFTLKTQMMKSELGDDDH